MKKRISKQLIVHACNLPLYCNGTVFENNSIINITNNINSNLATGIHPKIYLPIVEKKILSCPYCGVEYIFSDI